MVLTNRIQKITEALYRVTELLSDKEPLKWLLRNEAVELFDFLASKENKEIWEGKGEFDLIRKINRTLQLAASSDTFVSNINFEILRREYLALGDFLREQIKTKKQEFQSLQSIQNFLPISISNGQISNGQDIDSNGHNGQTRKKQILGLFKENEWVSSQEILALLSQFSPKSIQRDLLEMVNSGILKKTGDKRWRKYSLT